MATDYTTIFVSAGTAFVGVVGALMGVWLTDLGNSRRAELQNANELSKERALLLRERGEELYKQVHAWQSALRASTLGWQGAMDRSYSVNDALDMEIANGQRRDYDFGRIAMLVDVYYPGAKNALDNTLKLRDQHASVVVSFKRKYKAGLTDVAEYSNLLLKAALDFEKACDVLKAAIVEGLRGISRLE